uniref:Uncharacterized protein n=1 Tax=Physcomitrium patens TaxID=3218 RepID=A0A2K1J172_PHYPA|nr:hypothetical protein PHYPA_023180 [Physcomitrium patens]
MRKATHKVRTTDDILGCNTTRIKQIKTNKGETQKQRKPLSLVFQIIHTRSQTFIVYNKKSHIDDKPIR